MAYPWNNGDLLTPANLNYKSAGPYVDARWFDVDFTYNPGVSSPVDNTEMLQDAIDYAYTVSAYSAYEKGSIVMLPKGFGYFTEEIVVPNGVFLEGQGTMSTGLAFNGTNAITHAIRIGEDNATAAFGCGLRKLTVRNLQTPATTNAGTNVIYTDSAQHDGGLDTVYIFGGGRTCFKAELGYGGATTMTLRDVETHNYGASGGAPDNAQVILDIPSAFIEVGYLITQGMSDGTSGASAQGLVINSGYVHVKGYHVEWIANGITIEQDTSPHHTTIHNATGGSGVTNVVRSTASDRAGVHVLLGRILLNGATNSYQDNRGGGSTVAADIFLDASY